MSTINSRVKTETVAYQRMGITQDPAGGTIEVPVESLAPHLVLIRPMPPALMEPGPDGIGLTRPPARHMVWDDLPNGRLVDQTWQFVWSPSDGGPDRILRPTARSRWCPINKFWATTCIEVASQEVSE